LNPFLAKSGSQTGKLRSLSGLHESERVSHTFSNNQAATKSGSKLNLQKNRELVKMFSPSESKFTMVVPSLFQPIH